MNCCGKRREWLRVRFSPPVAAANGHSLVEQRTQDLAYIGNSSIVIRGSATGLTYLFGNNAEMLAVDERDAAELLATERFVRKTPGQNS
jgi:hypothetical protein